MDCWMTGKVEWPAFVLRGGGRGEGGGGGGVTVMSCLVMSCHVMLSKCNVANSSPTHNLNVYYNHTHTVSRSPAYTKASTPST
jgi:hypothetical protein